MTRRLKWTCDPSGNWHLAITERDSKGDRIIEHLPDPDFAIPANIETKKEPHNAQDHARR